jgi:mevalonate kinase
MEANVRISGTAPGKVILLGEHAVVYGRPAIVVPVWQTVATASVQAGPPGSGCILHAHDLGATIRLAAADDKEPLALVARLALAALGMADEPDWRIDLASTIPIAGGLGSGAAISTALVRAIFAAAGQEATPQEVSRLVYASERIYHGTPSGIDNTVVAYGAPIWFVRGEPPQVFTPAAPCTLVIADSGIHSPTKETVGDVRAAWEAQPARYEALFDAVAALVHAARRALAAGDLPTLGLLMDENQDILAQLGVSSPPLERLIDAARRAGAWGAKLSGGGRGGNVTSLVAPEQAAAVEEALLAAGAVRVIVTTVGAGE